MTLLLLSLVLLLLLLLVWLWYWSLKRQVKQRMAEFQRELALRRQVEEALRESEARYRELVQNANSIILRRRPDGIITFFNEYAQKFFGYTADEIMGQYIVGTIVPVTDKAGRNLARMIEDIGRNPDGYSNNENENMRRNGERVWIAWTNKAIYDQDGRILEILCIGNDITERKRAEEALRESEQKFKDLFEFAPEAIFLQTLEGRIIDCNIATEKMTGYSRKELLSMSVQDRIAYEVTVKLPEAGSGEIAAGGYSYETFNKRKGGEPYPVHISIKLLDMRNEKILLVIVHDLTERRKMEEELLKVQKLESLGVLAGGIAHDFNNILMAILGNVSLARISAGSEKKVRERLAETEKACARAQELTRQLLTFSKGGAPIKRVMSIARLIEDSATFSLRGSNVRCFLSIPDDLWAVEADEGQIGQVLNNLIINASQSMPEGGVIELVAENIPAEEVRVLPLEPGRYIRISVRDQGVGIGKEHLSKIFDPYFTTKLAGSGLGLAMVYSIVNRHGGYVDVESEPGEGTTFYVYLPASEREAPVFLLPVKKTFRGEGRILVMDDEENVRKIVGAMLRNLGYEVAFANDGNEAIEMYRDALTSGPLFDIVIMDLTIPGGMGGREAVKHLIEMSPAVKVVVSSGYSDDPVMADHEKYGFSGVISKPYHIEELSECLHRLIVDQSGSVGNV